MYNNDSTLGRSINHDNSISNINGTINGEDYMDGQLHTKRGRGGRQTLHIMQPGDESIEYDQNMHSKQSTPGQMIHIQPQSEIFTQRDDSRGRSRIDAN